MSFDFVLRIIIVNKENPGRNDENNVRLLAMPGI
jgi:hypothetical protein